MWLLLDFHAKLMFRFIFFHTGGIIIILLIIIGCPKIFINCFKMGRKRKCEGDSEGKLKMKSNCILGPTSGSWRRVRSG